MTQFGPKPGSQATQRLEAHDARADGRRRVVLIARDRVLIARSVAGVFMRIALAPRLYRGVALRIAGWDDAGFRHEIRLVHSDPDFDVQLIETRDDEEAHAAWRHWARYLNLQTLVERVEGHYEAAQPTPGASSLRAPQGRRRGRVLLSRRARFLARRKVGRPELTRFVTEKLEWFGGSRADR